MNREWAYQRVQNDATLTGLVGDRVYAATSLREDESTRSLTKPFIVYRARELRPEMRGDDSNVKVQDGFQWYVHDVPGDYGRIDQILTRLYQLFSDVRDQEAGIISEWLEMSEDFRDDDMHTIMRYCRTQIKYTLGVT